MGRFFLLLAALAAPALAATKPAELRQWRTGLTEINEGWAEHDGDDLKWAQPGFDDSAWQTVDVEDMGPAQTGWRWYRKRVNVGPDRANASFLVDAGEGAYELYVNGERVPGPGITSPFAVKRPTERVFELSNDQGDFQIALRTCTPPGYTNFHLPLFLSVTMGGPVVIEYERQALESQRLYSVVPSIAINLLLVLSGLGALALFSSQRKQRDYLFLGLYLLLVGISNGLWIPQQAGVLPISANLLIADPLIYLYCIAQIEFTFSFAGRGVGRRWRIYEGVLLTPLLLVVPDWMGRASSSTYDLVEALVTAPMALLMPVLLLVWSRRGNREAGWLVFPSLLPAAVSALYDLGDVSIFSGWRHFDFLDEPIPAGPISVHTADAASLLFLMAIGIVMFFRFTRVSREQARAAAELDAAREIQQRLVPASLPELPCCRIEAAYLPAQEVGGDFYQVLEQTDGGALIVVGDVSGKGLKAAMTGALTIGALRTLAGEELRPAALLSRLNRQIAAAQDGGFVTCLCIRLDASGAMTVANAGHLSPYRGGVEIPVDPGLPLGLTAHVEYDESEFQLSAGETLTLLSDGVVEAMNSDGQLFGFERTAAISIESAEEIARAAQHFGQEDDITVLTLTRLAAPLNA